MALLYRCDGCHGELERGGAAATILELRLTFGSFVRADLASPPEVVRHFCRYECLCQWVRCVSEKGEPVAK